MRVTWPDGSVDVYPPYAVLYLQGRPRRIDGRLYRTKHATTDLVIEAPMLITER